MSTRRGPENDAGPRIHQVDLMTEVSEHGGVLTPSLSFAGPMADRATGAIGHVAYAILRSQAFVALPQLGTTIGTLADPLRVAQERYQSLPEAERAAATGTLELLGRATHWELIGRLGVIVDNLAALMDAVEAYRAGEDVDYAKILLRHELDVLAAVGAKRRRQLSYWERMANAPQQTQLLAAGLTNAEAKALKAGTRRWAFAAVRTMDRLRAYYTERMHHVYLRFKHGYTLVSPGVSRLHVRLRDAKESAAINDALARGFCIIHQTYDGRRILEIVQSSPEDLEACMRTAREAVGLAERLAVAWTLELEHGEGWSAATIPPPVAERAVWADYASALRKWAGPDFLAIYPAASPPQEAAPPD